MSSHHELHFFCETADHAGIAREIVSHRNLPAARARIFTLDCDQAVAAAMRHRESSASEDSIEFAEVFESLGSEEIDWLRQADLFEKRGIIRDTLCDYLQSLKDTRAFVVVQFGDTTSSGHAVAQVCRNIGIPRILVQTEFLDFVSKTDSLEISSPVSRFGNSRPDLACVWGPQTASKLVRDFGNHPDRVKNVGCTRPGLNFDLAPSVNEPARFELGLRIAWVGQDIVDSGKASRLAWFRDFTRLADILADFDSRYLPASVTTPETASQIRRILGVRVVLEPESEIGAILRMSDVCVTFHSSVFLDCITHHVPCIFVGMDSLDIEMPAIDHPLIFQIQGPQMLVSTLSKIFGNSVTCRKTANNLSNYVSSADGIANTSSAIAFYLEGLDSEPKVDESIFYLDGVVPQTKTLIAVGGSFGSHTGVGMSLAALYQVRRCLPFKMVIHLCNRGTVKRLHKKILGADYIVLNSLEVIDILSKSQLNELLVLCEKHGKKVFFYLHETNFTFLRLRLEHPEKVENFLRSVLPTVNVLCVSDAQARWITGLGAGPTYVLHEAVAFPFEMRPVPPPAKPHGVAMMAGTIQPRKGATLFSRAADLARHRSDDLEFHWLGQTIKISEKCYLSQNVHWRGFLSGKDFWSALLAADVFVLSSVDDPFPLSVGQALHLGKPCIVYRESGFAEVIEKNHWGEVYDIYDEEELYRKIRKVMDNLAGYVIDLEEVKSLLSVKTFAGRLIDAVGTMPTSPCFDREIVRSRAGDEFLDECEFLEGVPSKNELELRNAICFRVAYSHFAIGGVVPECIREIPVCKLKPLAMSQGFVAIGRHDLARIISETCLRRNPRSSGHQQIIKVCMTRAADSVSAKSGTEGWRISGDGIYVTVSRKHLTVDGTIPDEVAALDGIDLKPLAMANLLMALGHPDYAKKISESCLLKNPNSELHKKLLVTCKNPPSLERRFLNKPQWILNWVLGKSKTKRR